MNKKTLTLITILVFGAVLIGACTPVTPVASAMDTAVQSNTTTANAALGNGYGNGPGTTTGECEGNCQHQVHGGGQHGQHGQGGQHGQMGAQVPAYAIGEITQAEADGLAFMREEEKLARDVYLTLYDAWGLRTFSNIASSEQTHTDAVKGLLEMYQVNDPVVDDTIGVFVNSDLQALYNDLIEKGNTSLVDALEVGAAIEEIDILDLIDYIEDTDETNLEWVYENLLAGSENHLRAFVKQYETQTGETYVPQYLTQEMFDAIMSASSGNGGGRGHGQGGGHSHGNGGGNNG